MQIKYSLAVFIYAITTIIDAALGITTYDPVESYLYKIAAAATIIAMFLYLINKNKRFILLPLISASFVLSIVVLTQDQTDLLTITNVVLKLVAITLTLKPELIEIELITDEEDEDDEENTDS
jgi:hypothetical protein